MEEDIPILVAVGTMTGVSAFMYYLVQRKLTKYDVKDIHEIADDLISSPEEHDAPYHMGWKDWSEGSASLMEYRGSSAVTAVELDIKRIVKKNNRFFVRRAARKALKRIEEFRKQYDYSERLLDEAELADDLHYPEGGLIDFEPRPGLAPDEVKEIRFEPGNVEKRPRARVVPVKERPRARFVPLDKENSV